MDKKEFIEKLKNLKMFKKEIENLQKEQERHMSLLCKCYDFENVDERHQYIIYHSECLSRLKHYNEKIESEKALYRTIEYVIDELDIFSKRMIVEHYINGKTWNEVGEITHYSEGGARKIAAKIVEELTLKVTSLITVSNFLLHPYQCVYKVVDGQLVRRNCNWRTEDKSVLSFKDLKDEGWLPLKEKSVLPKGVETKRIKEEYNVTDNYIEINYVVAEDEGA